MLITNPYATSTTEEGREALTTALARRYEVEAVPTTHRRHAAELGARAAREGFDAVVIHGGDGSVNETVNGLLGAPDRTDRPAAADLPAIGVVPGGNANVFARALGVDRRSDRAVDQLFTGLDRGTRRTVGLGHALNRWFLFNAGMGMDAIVIRRMEEQRAAGKKVTNLRYVATAVSSFLSKKYPSPTFAVEVPGHPAVEGARFGFVSNVSPWTYLGPRAIRTNPGTDFDHGLGIAAATSLSASRNLMLGAQLLAGSADPRAAHLFREDDVDRVVFTSGEPADVQMDGDYMGMHRSLEFGCIHHVLNVVCP